MIQSLILLPHDVCSLGHDVFVLDHIFVLCLSLISALGIVYMVLLHAHNSIKAHCTQFMFRLQNAQTLSSHNKSSLFYCTLALGLLILPSSYF